LLKLTGPRVKVSSVKTVEAAHEQAAGTWTSVVGRGAGLLAAAGAVLGGAAGTVDWPVVGTLFGGVQGAAAGGVVGVVDGLALSVLVRGTRSSWAARALSGGVSALAAVLGASAYEGPSSVPRAVEVVLVVAAILVGGAAGPLIAHGLVSAPGGRPSRPGLSQLFGRFLAWGAGLGAALGGVAGGIVGAFAYLPTAPFAVVEGAVFGAVAGAVLACLAAGLALVLRSPTSP
jgi:hypothetical protein